MVANNVKGTPTMQTTSIENLLRQYIMYLLDEESKALREKKHVDLKYHFIRELAEENKFTLEFTSRNHMWVDLKLVVKI